MRLAKWGLRHERIPPDCEHCVRNLGRAQRNRLVVRPRERALAWQRERVIEPQRQPVGALPPRLCTDQMSCLRPVADLKASNDLFHDAIGLRHALVLPKVIEP
jgi:hypothetical protein